MLKTRVCDILGIQYPIVQSPMNYIVTPELVAAVSNAGGLGICSNNMNMDLPLQDPQAVAEHMRAQIRQVRKLTSKPFGVNIVVGQAAVAFEEAVTQVVMEEGAPAVYSSLGSPSPDWVRRLHGAGIRLIHIGTSVRHAIRAEEAGVDIFACAGYEAGGHSPGKSETPLFVLLPQVVDAVKIPVLAGCGVGDARGMVAAFALGAEGICMGTRFLATHESRPHPRAKQAIVDADDTATVAWGKKLGVGLGRTLKNRFTQKYLEMELSGATAQKLQAFVEEYRDAWGKGLERRAAAYFVPDLEWGEFYMGAVAGLIREIKGAGDVVRDMAAGVDKVLARLSSDPLSPRLP
ncbi:MAG: nitronate monooxygenase [Chloroflexi bacterium]|nr:nitronate monooxygenase [Chloroflexota bacterium]